MIGGEKKKIIYLGSDHAGFKVKSVVKDYLEGKGFEVTDLGCFSEDPCDYPDIAREVAEKVIERDGANGVLLCGSGIGMAIAANRYKGVRAVVAVNEDMAETSRKHNNANVLTLAARVNSEDEIKKIVEKFFTTEFEKGEERHVRRVEKMDSLG